MSNSWPAGHMPRLFGPCWLLSLTHLLHRLRRTIQLSHVSRKPAGDNAYMIGVAPKTPVCVNNEICFSYHFSAMKCDFSLNFFEPFKNAKNDS